MLKQENRIAQHVPAKRKFFSKKGSVTEGSLQRFIGGGGADLEFNVHG